eukprot:TRINITY_DN13757_c0_g1_i1.p1 TRINITY_DN13757_c0_g1~~TRINITY_DN13757_c0_g1_i1.p1  ORF type:complete len:239 (-),score=43.54 TRINITY_DN13757_c0_g1_i1:72-788(-)
MIVFSKKKFCTILFFIIFVLILQFKLIDSSNKKDYDFEIKPWLTDKQKIFMTDLMKGGNKLYLEYGTGGSTLSYGILAKKAYSVEHNKDWCNKISSIIDKNSLNIVYRCSPVEWVGFEPGSWKEFDKYVKSVDEFDQQYYDVIFVDGRARAECSTYSIPYMKKDTILVIDNFWDRPRYHHILPLFQVLKTDTENMVVLKLNNEWFTNYPKMSAIYQDLINKMGMKISPKINFLPNIEK